MSMHDDWKDCATHYLKIRNIRNELRREFKSENPSLKHRESLQIFVPKHYSLVVDIMLVSELSVDLAHLIMKNPLYAEKVFIEAVEDVLCNDLQATNVNNSLPNSSVGVERITGNVNIYRPFQMHVSFQLQGIPSHLFYSSQMMSQSSTFCGLLAFRGVLVSLTPVLKYIRSKVYSCSDSICPESTKRRMSTSCTSIPKECHICASNMIEHTEERDIGNVIKAIVSPKPAATLLVNRGPHPPHHFHHGIFVRLCDNLTLGIQLGEEYDFAGYIGPKGMYAYYVHKSSPYPIVNMLSWSKLNDILALKAQLEPSPWAFFIAIASQLSSDLYPVSSFLHLKRGLLSSIVSLVCMNQPIQVLAVGSENLPAHRFMLHASMLNPHYVVHSNQQSIIGRVRWQEEALEGNSLWLDAGTLFLAQGGVCYVGDWEKNSRETQSAVLSVIERRQIAITSEKKTPMYDVRLPLKSAIWTHMGKKKAAKLRSLINVFGIPFIMDLTEEEQNDVAGKMLCRPPYDAENHDNWREGIKMFLQNISSSEVRVNPKATKLIKDYFVASRRCRRLSDPDQCLPIGALDVIIQMAEAHARLSMHSTVTHEDALAAINVCEEAMAAIYGCTFMPIIPPLKIKEGSPLSHFIDNVNSHMKQFDHWLDRFLKDFIDDSTSQFPREE